MVIDWLSVHLHTPSSQARGAIYCKTDAKDRLGLQRTHVPAERLLH